MLQELATESKSDLNMNLDKTKVITKQYTHIGQ